MSSDVGLGVSARNIVRLLAERGLPVTTLDIETDRARDDSGFKDVPAVDSVESLPYAVNLICVSLHSLPSFLGSRPTLLREGFLNVAVVYWELAVLPELWVKALELLDVALTTSTFVRSTLETHLSYVPVIYAAYPAYMPQEMSSSRARYGLPESAILFVNSFDPASDVERKNPFGLIEAFQAAFRQQSNVGLVIKLNVPRSTHEDDHRSWIVATLRSRCTADPRIHLIDEPLDYPGILGLYKACDVFVSLHRAEGLGLGPMEAMALGKPVIATAWSGNMTFMNHTNACLVEYQLVPVKGSGWVYRFASRKRNALWADPDLAQAAAWMRALAGDSELQASIGQKAAYDMACFQRNAARAEFVEEIRSVLEQRAFMPTADHGRKQYEYAALKIAVRDSAASRPKKLIRRAWRFANRHLLWRFGSGKE